MTIYRDGIAFGTSTPGEWWTNGITTITPNGSSVTAINTSAYDYNILLVKSNAETQKIDIVRDHIGLVVLEGAILTGVTAAGYDHTIETFNSKKYFWFEGTIGTPGQKNSNVRLNNAAFAVFRHFHTIGANWYGMMLYGTRHRFENVTSSRHNYSGIWSAAKNMTMYNVKSTNNNYSGLYLSNNTNDSIFVNILVANNGYSGIEMTNTSANRNTILNFTAANNGHTSYGGIRVDGYSANNVFVNGIVANNKSYGIHIDGVEAGGNRFAQIAAIGNGVTDIKHEGNANSLAENILVTTDNCGVVGGSINIDSNCTGGTGVNVVEDAFDISNSFVGFLSTNEDSSNSAEDLSASVLSANITPHDWYEFDHFFRAWSPTETANFFPHDDNRNRCVGGNCQIWDWSLKSTDIVFRNKTGNGSTANTAFTNSGTCPPSIRGDKTIVDSITGATNTFLMNATEIVGDSLGDEDGLCESNEACLYSPNFGIYQGSGDFSPLSCLFIDGTVSGVTMFAYPTNGE